MFTALLFTAIHKWEDRSNVHNWWTSQAVQLHVDLEIVMHTTTRTKLRTTKSNQTGGRSNRGVQAAACRPVSHITVPFNSHLLHFQFSSLLVALGRWLLDCSGSCSPCRRQMEFRAPGFGMAQPWVSAIWGVHYRTKEVFIYVSLPPPFFVLYSPLPSPTPIFKDLFTVMWKTDFKLRGYRGLSSIGSFLKWPQWPELSWTKPAARCFFLVHHMGAGI